ncbi:MAG: RnfABCDGE type electron transport complex subunit D [Planctomycetota bacterium]
MGDSRPAAVTGWRGVALRRRLVEAIRSTEDQGPPWLGAGRGLWSVDGPMVGAAAVMQASAVWWYGWGTLALGVLGALCCVGVYGGLSVVQRRAGLGAGRIDWWFAVWMGWVSVLMLPAGVAWGVAAGVGVATGLLAHATGRGHRSRCHPAGLAVLLLWSATVVWPGPNPDWLRSAVQPTSAVMVDRAGWLAGEVVDEQAAGGDAEAGWVERGNATRLIAMGRGEVLARPGTLSRRLEMGELPGLEWVLLGGVAGPMGGGAGLVMVWIGLGLVWARVHSWRVMLSGVVGCLVALAVVPGWVEGRLVWGWVEGPGLLTGEGLLSVAYPLVASPMPLVLGVLAASGSPMSRGGRWVYGLTIGLLGMACFLWLSQPEAGLVGLVAGGMLSRPLDGLRRRRYGVKSEAGREEETREGEDEG